MDRQEKLEVFRELTEGVDAENPENVAWYPLLFFIYQLSHAASDKISDPQI
jgi:hypothetical protein